MPTGYTAEVADGTVTDFRTFALRCARNFGATIMQRDDPMNEPPKHREPSDFYERQVREAKERAATLAMMTLEDAERMAEAEYAQAMTYYHSQMRERNEQRNRYNAMLTAAMAWNPPTPDHEPMKQFMIDQLVESRRFDCTYQPTMPTKRDAVVWLRENIADADARVDRAAQSYAEELDRCAKANAWIDALYTSLNEAPAPQGAAS